MGERGPTLANVILLLASQSLLQNQPESLLKD